MKVVFLDRDGVINEDPGRARYVTSWKNFKFIKGAKEAIALLTKHGYDIYVVSNQRGVSEGLFKKSTLEGITKKMLAQIRKSGGDIKKVMYCIHPKEKNCDCRKPKTGLFIKAAGDLGCDFRQAYFIGDDKPDIEAGRNLGCKTVLVLSGKTQKKQLHEWEFLPDRVEHDLLHAVKKAVLGGKV